MRSPVGGTTAIEDLVQDHPAAVRFLIGRGLPCLVCGEPIWGTFAELARSSGLDESAMALLVDDLNRYLTDVEGHR